MKTSIFDYSLPPELIAQEPLPRRDSSRLMHVERSTGRIEHLTFDRLPSLLAPPDCLILNDSRVFPGRLEGRKAGTGGRVELLLLEKTGEATWKVLAGGASIRPGARLEIGEELEGEVLAGPSGGRASVRFEVAGAPAGDGLIFSLGRVPLPPYVKGEIPDPEVYQTVYARREISAASPTAGLHFTPALLRSVRGMGVATPALELAVGMDTFAPVREEEVEDHAIHSEWFSVPRECAEAVNLARESGGRRVAVGTTTVRALESASSPDGRLSPVSGRTQLFIKPGYRFRAVDALVTNFHFPRSTLLMLVCAFGGTELVLEAYREAVRERYRFYSFGDAMVVT